MLNSVFLLDLAAHHARWATTRQATVAGNIANAGTAGYTAVDIEPFFVALDRVGSFQLAATGPRHVDSARAATGGVAGYAVQDSGMPVSLDQELVKADQTDRAFALDTTIIQAFHRMMLAAIRSGT